MKSAFDTVLVDQHANTGEVLGQHVRLVAGAPGVEKNAVAIGNDARREKIKVLENAVAQPLDEGAGAACQPEKNTRSGKEKEGSLDPFDPRSQNSV